MHKDTTYQGSDRQDLYRHGKKKKNKNKKKKRKKRKQTNKTQTSTGFAIGNPVKRKVQCKTKLEHGIAFVLVFRI